LAQGALERGGLERGFRKTLTGATEKNVDAACCALCLGLVAVPRIATVRAARYNFSVGSAVTESPVEGVIFAYPMATAFVEMLEIAMDTTFELEDIFDPLVPHESRASRGSVRSTWETQLTAAFLGQGPEHPLRVQSAQ